MGILSKILGDANLRYLNTLRPLVDKVNGFEKKYESFSNEELKNLKINFQECLKKGDTLENILPEAFAAVREAAKRTLNQRHYDVQLIGGIVLHKGQIAEMRTGEGKTLSATLAAYLNALEGKGVHVVTVNDYLARRDTVWMGQIYHALGMTVGCIQHESAFLYDPSVRKVQDSEHEAKELDEQRDKVGGYKVVDEFLRPITRQEAYLADITYGTNNEFGFDYLRDNMVSGLDQMVQRGLHYAIVDEIDSILIDEARTPLIISAPDAQSSDMYKKFAQLVKRLKENEDYNIDEKMRASTLTNNGITKMENLLGVENIYTEGGTNMAHHIEQALKAEVLFRRDKDYVVKDGEIIIVDEFTGRLMYGRRYSEGLHQAIEAKEDVEVRRESRTLATITFQNLFRMYKKLSGMTGTAANEAEEFSKIYKLDVTVIPTNKSMIRSDMSDRIYKSEAGKFKAVAKEVKERHEKGQPVLIGTISIEKNELIGELLKREGIEVNILNAKQHEKEGNIIAQAGRLGAVTVATNMAGRGVDVILGGNPPDKEEAKKVREVGGLHIIGTERHESRRIDNQLRGRSGRQGDPGSSQFYVSTQDDLMRIFGSEKIGRLMDTLKIPEDMPIENKMISKALETAQKKVEGFNFDTRKHLVEYDDVINKHRGAIYKKRRQILELAEAQDAERGVNDLESSGQSSAQTLKDLILEMIDQEIEQVVMFHTASDNEDSWNLEEIYEVVGTIFPVSREVRVKIGDIQRQAGDKLEDAKSRTKIINYLYKLAVQAYNDQEKLVSAALDQGAMKNIEKMIILRTIDNLWMEHLDSVAELRRGIGLRGYGQRDPLVEYKREAYIMFNELMNLINKQIVYNIFKVGLAQKFVPGMMQSQNISFSAPSKIMERGQTSLSQIPQALQNKTATQAEAERRGSQKPINNTQTYFDGKKIGRNDPCPCGSGKKFKKCHGQ